MIIKNVRELKCKVLTTINREVLNAMKESIRKDGIRQPIIIDSNNYVIDGQLRLYAAIEAGITEVPCIIQESNNG